MPSSSTSDSDVVTLLISKTHNVDKNIVILDAQSPIHLVSNAELLSDISETTLPIIVQFTIEDKVRVAQAGFISDIVVNAYYGPHTAANILSCHELQETQHIHYDETQDTFCATPVLVGPALTFHCVNGFWTLSLYVKSSIFFDFRIFLAFLRSANLPSTPLTYVCLRLSFVLLRMGK
jgi:hypothetical protein